MSPATFLAPAASLLLGDKAFFDAVGAALGAGARPVTLYGQPADAPADLTLTMVLESEGRLEVLRGSVDRARGYHSLTPAHPALHVFERELHEQHGVTPHGHPWLKPVRFPGGAAGGMDDYPFHRLEGKGVHEVAVGPIHAGVIEPAHFRFMCLGETVHHLEIQLGYQHRGAEPLLLQRDPRLLAPLVETIAGDASVAHAWAYADALEALAGLAAPEGLERSRGVGLELERIGMHLAGLSGMASDVAFMQGAASYGRLRTTVINATMLVCGSRFGRGWVRPGAVRFGLPTEAVAQLRQGLDLVARDVAIINRRVDRSGSLRHRLLGVGVVTQDQATELGLVGAVARASGVDLDLRARLPGALYQRLPVTTVVEAGGDCWARAMIRVREIDESIRWVRAALDAADAPGPVTSQVGPLAPGMLAVGVRESWRGEVVHALETDATGRLRAYKVQDPSLRNWFGLAQAVRGNDISDFPICNKSFDLSYCGNDL
jgi:Ni,Fe-hydrogenase III large subunit